MPAWHEVRDAPARFSAERVERDGVSVLCVRLAGHAEDNPDGVGRIRDALDEFAAAQPDIEVTTLDVSEFSNASDDACSILTRVFDGLPCCWITSEWDQQHGEERWDLPPSARMAPTHAEALSRVVQWRLAGGCDYSDGTVCKWTDRGLVIAITGMEDLWHRNRLVERMIADTAPPTLVGWPFPDRSGATHEALRRGVRLVTTGAVVIEADFSPYSTRRPLPANWVESIADLVSLRRLCLRDTTPRAEDLLRVLPTFPVLEELVIERGIIDRAELLRIRPALVVR